MRYRFDPAKKVCLIVHKMCVEKIVLLISYVLTYIQEFVSTYQLLWNWFIVTFLVCRSVFGNRLQYFIYFPTNLQSLIEEIFTFLHFVLRNRINIFFLANKIIRTMNDS